MMDKRKSFRFINICFLALISLIALTGSTTLLSSSLFSQQADPFYLRLLTQGEKSFLARNYTEAAKELGIAAFGLHREKKLKAKALVYLSMCHYYLKDIENSEKYLWQASDLVGREEIVNLEKEIDESARNDFQKLLVRFKLAPGEAEEESPKIPEKTEKLKTQIKKKATVEKDPVKALEKSIKTEPRNISLIMNYSSFTERTKILRLQKKHLKTWSRRIRVRSMASFYWER